MGSALVVAEKMGIRSAMFWPAATGLRLSLLLIPNMIKDGIIDANGKALIMINSFQAISLQRCIYY